MVEQGKNPSEHILILVNDALSDIESVNIPLSSIIRKCIRIARLRNDYVNLWWLEWELTGLPPVNNTIDKIIKEILPHFSKDEFESYRQDYVLQYINERRMLILTVDLKVDEEKVTIQSVGEIELNIENCKRTIDRSVPPQGLHPVDLYFKSESYNKSRIFCSTILDGENKILERIRQRVHHFLSQTEKQLLFGQINADIFEKNRIFVDLKLGEICPEALSQFSSVYCRLREKDPESYAQAATSCRRIIKSLADALYPPSDEPITCNDGNVRILNDDKYKNRLIQYIQEQSANSASRKLLLADVELLINKIEKLYGLTCKGPHAKISEFEINQCVIQTYLLTGDMLRISENESAIVIEDSNPESP
ncbi:hypothetical protein [Methanothrix sp.]|jgi:hypothetical protein|uniref:hypothetical protein n=1 Tax=Methanothrix sp. TaxID=90426 RepID=UPI003BB69BF3